MRFTLIMGSPRRDGNTAAACEWMQAQWEADGHEVTRIDVVEHRIQGCQECWICRGEARSREALCEIDDDANGILRRMTASDVIVLATPVFCWGFPSHMKALVDRMYCLADDFLTNPDYETRLQGKRMGLLVVAGGGEENNAELLAPPFNNLTGFLKCENGGHLMLTHCTLPEDLGEGRKEKTEAFARELEQPATQKS